MSIMPTNPGNLGALGQTAGPRAPHPQAPGANEGASFKLGGTSGERSSSTLGALDRFENVFKAYSSHFRKFQDRISELERRDKAFHAMKDFKPTMPEYVEFQRERLSTLFQLQMESHQVAFAVESAAKVIEHATSGARTVLQTQT